VATSQHEHLDARLAAIERTLADIDARVRRLELSATDVPTAATVLPWPSASGTRTRDVAGTLTLIGRTFVIIAGAYLLRAVSETGVVERGTAAAIAMGYALVWTVVAYRTASQPLSATFFGACTVLIGFPLLWEATMRFALLSALASAFAVATLTGVVLLTAWRQHLHALAWLGTTAACGLAIALLVGTGAAVPFTCVLIALGVVTLWLGYDREWTKLRWVTAFFADIAVLALIGRALATPPRDAPAAVMAVQLLLLVVYLGSIAIRTLARGRDVIPFEAVQTIAMLGVGLAGALLLAHRTGVGDLALGPALLALAAAAYAVAASARWRTRGANHIFYTSLGLVFALTGGELMLDGAPLTVLWVALGIVTAWAARRDTRHTLAVHSLIYVTCAAVSSGLVATGMTGLFAPVSYLWSPVHAGSFTALAALVLCWILLTDADVSGRSATRALRLTLAVLIVTSVAGLAVVVVRSLLPAVASPAEAAMVATLRTGVLAVTALAVAWLGRHITAREFGSLLYPALAWGALKLLVEDFRMSPPLMLVVALALYGGALILGPRIAKVDGRT
jgi:hypothetical protein